MRDRRPVPHRVIPARVEREIAVASECDTRTVRRWLVGQQVSDSKAQRIAYACTQHGSDVFQGMPAMPRPPIVKKEQRGTMNREILIKILETLERIEAKLST